MLKIIFSVLVFLLAFVRLQNAECCLMSRKKHFQNIAKTFDISLIANVLKGRYLKYTPLLRNSAEKHQIANGDYTVAQQRHQSPDENAQNIVIFAQNQAIWR